MDDAQILGTVRTLVDREHDLRARLARGELSTDEEHAALRQAEEELDQCWDLLRQRRAQRSSGHDADDAAARPVAQVEGYLQ